MAAIDVCFGLKTRPSGLPEKVRCQLGFGRYGGQRAAACTGSLGLLKSGAVPLFAVLAAASRKLSGYAKLNLPEAAQAPQLELTSRPIAIRAMSAGLAILSRLSASLSGSTRLDQDLLAPKSLSRRMHRPETASDRILGAHELDVALGSPTPDVLPLQRHRHQLRELIGRAGEHRQPSDARMPAWFASYAGRLGYRCAPASKLCDRDRRFAGRSRCASQATAGLQRRGEAFPRQVLGREHGNLDLRRSDEQTQVLQQSTDLVLEIAFHLDQEGAALQKRRIA